MVKIALSLDPNAGGHVEAAISTSHRMSLTPLRSLAVQVDLYATARLAVDVI